MTHKEAELSKPSAARFNAGKLQWSLVDWDCIECMIEPYSSRKHESWNKIDLAENIFYNLTKILSGNDRFRSFDLCGDTLAMCAVYESINMDSIEDVCFVPNDEHQAPSWAAVDFRALAPMVRVLEYGAKKYDRHNWKKGQLVTELCDSAMRHAIALMSGEERDLESGISHVGHIMCNVMFIKYNLTYLRKEYDDRYFDGNKGILTPFGKEVMDKWYASVDPVDPESEIKLHKKV